MKSEGRGSLLRSLGLPCEKEEKRNRLGNEALELILWYTPLFAEGIASSSRGGGIASGCGLKIRLWVARNRRDHVFFGASPGSG